MAESERLYVKCKNCGEEFTGRWVKGDRFSLETTRLVDMEEECPHCGHLTTYSKPPDYYLR
jgi:rRNA maturation protein Nop10